MGRACPATKAHMRIFALLAALAITACGGGAVDAPKPAPAPIHFGWWGQGFSHNNHLASSAPGDLALVQGFTASETRALVDQAVALGKKPVVMLWAIMWQGKPDLRGDWREVLEQVKDPRIYGYYLADEPELNGWGRASLDALSDALPAGLVMMSVSTVGLATYIPARVNLIGVNIYHAHGDTPQAAIKHLDALAARGRRMYLNLDGMAFTTPAGCVISEAHQRKSIELNEAMLAWARKRSDVDAVIAFLWQSEANVCGAADMPILREYLLKAADNARKGVL